MTQELESCDGILTLKRYKKEFREKSLLRKSIFCDVNSIAIESEQNLKSNSVKFYCPILLNKMLEGNFM